MENKNIYIISGPTGVGKTSLSIKLAKKMNGEIICADSMQIYKGMDIGTAKATVEEQEGIPHHMIDVVSPFESFTVHDYSNLARDSIEDCIRRGKTPIIVGGTGLYLNSLIYKMDFAQTPNVSKLRIDLENMARDKGNQYIYDILTELDKDAALRIHPNNIKRVIRAIEIAKSSDGSDSLKDFKTSNIPSEYFVKLAGLTLNRDELYDRINQRVDKMIDDGLLDEVKQLISLGLDVNHQSMQGIGYKELFLHLGGEYDLDTAINIIKQSSRRYAKRQFTWLRRYDSINWFDVGNSEELEDAVLSYFLS